MKLHLPTSDKQTKWIPLFKGMHLNPITLRFKGPLAYLENQFQKDYLAQSINQIRISIILGAILYALFGILDMLLIPEAKNLTWLIRYAFVCPILILTVVALRYQNFQAMIQPILSFLIIVSGSGIIVMILIAPPPVNYSYYAGLILIFLFGYTFLRAQFIWASLGAWFLVVLYEIAAIVIAQTPAPVLINNNFFFISANLIGMMACYSIELYARRDFYLVQLLEEEQKKVQIANRDLEQRIRKRTIDLESANQELASEITERKRAEEKRVQLAEQLKKAEKMEAIGSMAAGVAHDLNNILSGLVSYPELLLMDLPDDSPFKPPILTMKKSGEKAAAMVQDLLTLARRGMANREVINPNTIISDYVNSPEFLNLKQQNPQVNFNIDLKDSLLNVFASPIQLSKAIMNLVYNAVEAQSDQGEVTIATDNRSLDKPLDGYEVVRAGDYAIITVRDNGIGIAEQDLEHIFEPFYTKKQLGRSGTGLGMSVVWASTKDAGGYIDIQSRKGRGTTFTLYIPITHQPSNKSESAIPIEEFLGTESVLVVDDIAEQREIAKVMLEKLGYAVTTLSSGEKALDYLRENEVDLILLDMIMDPGIDGCETYRQILKRHPHQKAVIASGYSDSKRLHEVQQIGAGAHIQKPYTLEKLGLTVRNELDRKFEE